MATAPQLELRDGSGYTTNLNYTTNLESVVIQGTLTNDTVALQVSVNGGPFVTDTNLLKIEVNNFQFPNPNTYPSGFMLSNGVNQITFRAIDIVGGVSAASVAQITKVDTLDLIDLQSIIPTGIKVKRRRNSVDIYMALSGIVDNTNFRGFNLYASRSAAGTSGYYKVNEKIIPNIPSDVYDEQTYLTFDANANWSDSYRKSIRVLVTEYDVADNTPLVTRYDNFFTVSNTVGMTRFKAAIESYTVTNYAVFTHYRFEYPGIINADQWVGVDDTSPLYYVVSSVFFDPTTNTEYESPFSQEVLGTPMMIDTFVTDLPNRTQTNIVTDYINLVSRVNAEISLVPGSTTRDVSIDPFASEAERLWFLMDYVHRSQSFLTLLQIDSVANNGISDPVVNNTYKSALKSALGYSSDLLLQNLIDLQFEKLAKNVNKVRLPGRSAFGQVVFYTTSKPVIDVIIPANVVVQPSSTAIEFTTGGAAVIPAANSEAYYNYNTKRYEVVVDITAITPGADGNVPAGDITTVIGVSGVSVINTEATVGGSDVESNADLATRCIISFAAVDTGTESGYYQAASEQVGIVKTKVVKSGDRLMMRDWDDLRKKHAGGKVDIWIQGLKERQVTEKFAFSYEVARDIQCEVLDANTLTFRVLDSRVTPLTPIIELLNVPSQGLGIRNATVGMDYDLTDAMILDYQTIRLSTAIPQPATTLDDTVYADYRFRYSNKFIFGLQPVRRVTSVVGEASGSLSPDINYKLYKNDDPLMDGESTAAKNYLSVQQASGKPLGDQIAVNDESHVLIGFVQEPLNSIGINTSTIRVFSQDRTKEYSIPEDYEVVLGTDRTPPKIVRTSTSTIVSGQQVSVDYTKDENFTVTYVVNDLLQQLQAVINNRRHVTADVLVKQAIVNPIDIETTIQLMAGNTKDKVDPGVRTNVSFELNKRVIGQGVAQSDVIKAVDSTKGVDYEVIPLARMAYSDGSQILREGILSTYQPIPALDIGGQRVFLLLDALNYPTTINGAYETEHSGVFQDDEALTLVDDPLLVGFQPYQAYIIGNDGMILPGYNDSTTATNVANRVLVSLPNSSAIPQVPTDHSYSVSYHVRGDKGPHDISGSEVEYLDLGNFTITYRAG